MRPIRIYVDTSVIGGCFDQEFARYSKLLIQEITQGTFIMVISPVVVRELDEAPCEVKNILASIPRNQIEVVEPTEEILELRDAYISEGIVDVKWMDDATHVAIATVARVDAIVSWNFKHIVRLDKIRRFNQVNLSHGYGILTILSPMEVVSDGDGN